ncbi:MAG: CcoQ/FixQ family Cbb3-type cytochrome c oxidase assembly chaperone [Mesorhizobium amorphae]|nr:MAG: CcoQ/FixQ family Cbb3-type cytochrome c oxidase assembly chaperone [Mesorhizobium amorphae]
MNFYEAFRHFADSWGLLALTLVFVAILVWVFRPGSRRIYRDQADIPFRHDREPKQEARRHD